MNVIDFCNILSNFNLIGVRPTYDLAHDWSHAVVIKCTSKRTSIKIKFKICDENQLSSRLIIWITSMRASLEFHLFETTDPRLGKKKSKEIGSKVLKGNGPYPIQLQPKENYVIFYKHPTKHFWDMTWWRRSSRHFTWKNHHRGPHK